MPGRRSPLCRRRLFFFFTAVRVSLVEPTSFNLYRRCALSFFFPTSSLCAGRSTPAQVEKTSWDARALYPFFLMRERRQNNTVL